MKRKLLTTSDGSQTFFVEELNENYHSTHGAIEESKTVFIQNAFNFCQKENINILEIGFGTGLNTFLTILENEKNNKQVNYQAIELYPITWEELKNLTYIKDFFGEKAHFFKKIHCSEWDKKQNITENFTLKKVHSDFTTYKFKEKFDIIYFDAFAPDIQTEMWTEEIFKSIYENLNKNGILTTYSAKGLIKRRLKKIGFQLQFLKHPHKREMIRAIKV